MAFFASENNYSTDAMLYHLCRMCIGTKVFLNDFQR